MRDLSCRPISQGAPLQFLMEFFDFDISPVASVPVNDPEQEEVSRIALHRRPSAAGGRSENPARIYFALDKPHSRNLTN